MVRNTHGGKGHKRSKRGSTLPREAVYKDDDQMYGVVTSMLGDYRVLVMCEDRFERVGTIRGSIRKSIWFSKDMHCIVSTRDFDDTKVDVIHGFTYDQSKQMGLDKLFTFEETNDRTVEFEINCPEEDLLIDSL
jgi:translation initiation factor 1A